MFPKSADADNRPKPAQRVLGLRGPCSGHQTGRAKSGATNLGGSVRNRSNLLVLLGIAFFVVGGIIVYVLTNDDDGDKTGSGSPVTVIVAANDIAAGSIADEMIDQGNLKEKEVPADQVVPGAVQSINQLQGATFVQGFADGQQVTAAGLQNLGRTFEVPAGYEAIAVQLDFVGGGAGYVGVGDRINIYGAYNDRYPLMTQKPHGELIVTNVEVLDVSLNIPARRGQAVEDPSTQRASSDSVTYLLALKTEDVERVVFTTEFHALYATLTAPDAPPAGPTPGRDGDNIFEIEPNVVAGA
jgi:Flp pilus assembly protein CpaB